MSFSNFTFDDIDIAKLAGTDSAAEISEHDNAVLALLKRLLQSHVNDKLSLLVALQKQLERDFLFWNALFSPELLGKQLDQLPVKECFQQINKIMQSCKHQLRYSSFRRRKVLTVGSVISSQEFSRFFEKSCLRNANILAQLCEALPCVIGYTPRLSITAVNCFDERIVLDADDLPYFNSLLRGVDVAKMDLPHLVTLEVGLPTWTFPQVVLLKTQARLDMSAPISEINLQEQLEQTNKINESAPLAELKTLFSQTKKNAQQKINQSKQQLSLLTKAMLNDDQFNVQEQEQIAALQSTVRQQVGQLQKHADDLTRFCLQFETDLQSLLA